VRAGPKDQSWDRAKATTTSSTKGRACAEVVGQSCGVVCVGRWVGGCLREKGSVRTGRV